MERNAVDKSMKYRKENGIHFVPVWRILGFSGANMAVNLYMGITMIMSYYLNGYVGMAVVLASSFSTIMRLWDGVTDPIVGFMVDKFGGRFGKTRLCLVVAALAVKHGSMKSAEMFHEYWLIVAVLATLGIVIAYISIAPKDIPLFSETNLKKSPKVKMSDYVEVLKKNRPLQMMIVTRATDMLANTCKTSAVMLVLYGIAAGNYQLSGGWTMYTTIIGLVMMTLGIGTIGRKLGLKKAMQIGSWGILVMDAVAIFIWVFCDPMTLNLPGYTNGYGEAFAGFSLFTVLLFLVTVVGGGFQMITSSIILPMIADVNDYEASRSGKYMPGMVGTLFSFMDKMISSFGPLLVGVGFAAIGFADKFPDLDTPYSTSLLVIGLLFYYGLELLGAVFNIVAMKFYDLSPEKMREVEKTIYEMREKDA